MRIRASRFLPTTTTSAYSLAVFARTGLGWVRRNIAMKWGFVQLLNPAGCGQLATEVARPELAETQKKISPRFEVMTGLRNQAAQCSWIFRLRCRRSKRKAWVVGRSFYFESLLEMPPPKKRKICAAQAFPFPCSPAPAPRGRRCDVHPKPHAKNVDPLCRMVGGTR